MKLSISFQAKHPWLNRSNLSLSSWNIDGAMPTVSLTAITLGKCHWKIDNMNVNIVKSDLRDVNLHVAGKRKRNMTKIRNTDHNSPSIKVLNSSIGNFFGQGINIKVSYSYFHVNTHRTVTPMFVLSLSTATISDCRFDGAYNAERNAKYELPSNRTFSSAIFDVANETKILIRECTFENIQVDFENETLSVLKATKSHVDITKSTFYKISTNQATISGVTSHITVADSIFSYQQGKAIDAQHRSKFHIHNSTFTYGSGIDLSDGTQAFVMDSLFSHNAGIFGASITTKLKSTLNVHNCTFTKNNATYGSGILAFTKTNVTVIDSLFSQNYGMYGGGINIGQKCMVDISNSTFAQNNARDGAGIHVDDYSKMSVKDSIFRNNTSTYLGGAIFVGLNSHLWAQNCLFHGNRACASDRSYHNSKREMSRRYFGQGNNSNDLQYLKSQSEAYSVRMIVAQWFKVNPLYQKSTRKDIRWMMKDVHDINLDSSNINGPNDPAGGAILSQGNSTLDLRSCQFIDNKATVFGGAVTITSTPLSMVMSCLFMKNSAYQGGALSIEYNSTISVRNSTFDLNSGDVGGSILAMNGVTMYIDKSSFLRNNVTTGGGVLALQSHVNVSISDSILADNIGTNLAGVVWAVPNCNVVFNRCNISNNTASKGSVYVLTNSQLQSLNTSYLHHSSNMIYMQSSQLILKTCYFSNNSLIHMPKSMPETMIQTEGKSNVMMMDSIFAHNEMSGMISAINSPVSINRCTFTDNIINGYGMISTGNSLLVVNDSLIGHNIVNDYAAILFGNALITFSIFINNTVDSRYGLLTTVSKKPNETLQVLNCKFFNNKGGVLQVVGRMDIGIDTCDFMGNSGPQGILYLMDNDASLRTSNTTFIMTDELHKVILYFDVEGKGVKITDYLTYEVSFASGNKTLFSGSSENFLQEALVAGLVVIDKSYTDYHVTQEESVYASSR